MKCPRCNSSKYTLNGTTKKGTVRYRCKECQKTWSNAKIGRPRRTNSSLDYSKDWGGRIKSIESKIDRLNDRLDKIIKRLDDKS